MPPVMYSQPVRAAALDHHLGAGVAHGEALARRPEANRLPSVAPYSTVLPMMVFSSATSGLGHGGRTTIVPPDRPLPT
jgi:hypothetical protein